MPTYPAELAAISLVHSLPSGPELMVNTFHVQHRHYTGNTFDWPTALSTLATKARDSWEASTIWANLQAGCKFQYAKASQIGTDGKVTATAVANSTVSGGKPGTDSFAALPYEVAMAVTILTTVAGSVVSNPRTGPNPSRQRRGRLYLGGFTYGVMDASQLGLFDATKVNAIGAVMSTFFNAIQGTHISDNAGGNYDYAKFGVASGVSGQFYQAERILIDRVPDSQRRRRNRQKQTGYAGTITHSE